MNNRISVIIPAFNAGRTLTRAIDSVLDQSHAAYEIIVVDDGSTDDTGNIIEGYKNHVISIYQQNQGSVAARQRGTEEVNAEYIAYLDADDYWPKGKLGLLTHIIERYSPRFLFSDFNRADFSSDEIAYLPKNSTFFPNSLETIVGLQESSKFKNLYAIPQDVALSLTLNGFPAYPSTMLVHRKSQLEAGGWDNRFKRSQDFDFTIRICQKYDIHYLNDVITTIGLHEVNNNLDAYIEMQTKGDIKVLNAHINGSNSQRYRKQCQAALAKKWINLGHTQFRLRKKRDAKHSYYRALVLPGKKLSATYHLFRSMFNL